MDEKLINDRIKRLRLRKKITLESLAKTTGFTTGYLSRIENSGSAPPISTLSKIAQALEADVSFFLSESKVESPKNMVIVKKAIQKNWPTGLHMDINMKLWLGKR